MAAALFLTLLFAATSRAEVFTDQIGRRVELKGRPERIVSLMPNVTEIVFALGAGERLQGVPLFSDEPPAAAKLPKVGSYVQPDLEKIVGLRPDLCLAVRDGNPKEVVERLTALGIPVYTIDPRNLEQIIESVQLLGQVLGAGERAAAIAREMHDAINRAAARSARGGFRPRVFFQIDASPIISAGPNTFIDELIRRAGGINLAVRRDTTPYPRYTWEEVLALQPDIVIIASMAGGYSEEELKAGWKRWPQLPAVRNNRLYVVSADLFDRPTPRLAHGLELLVDLFSRCTRE